MLRAQRTVGSPPARLSRQLAEEARREGEVLVARVSELERALAKRAETAGGVSAEEVASLRAYARLAGGAQRLARWRLVVGGVRVKRAEQRAALAEGSTARALRAVGRGGKGETRGGERNRESKGEQGERREEGAGGLGERRWALRCVLSFGRVGVRWALWRWRWMMEASEGMVAHIEVRGEAGRAEKGGGVDSLSAGRAESIERGVMEPDEREGRGREGWGRTEEHEEMLREAIRVGDAQTQRVLAMQRAMQAARYRLGGWLLRGVICSVLRAALLTSLLRWVTPPLHYCHLHRRTPPVTSEACPLLVPSTVCPLLVASEVIPLRVTCTACPLLDV